MSDKLMLIKEGFVNDKQVIKMLGRTPPNHKYSRPGKGGGHWTYVTGVYVKKVLNHVFGWNWSFEIVEHGREQNIVWVLGKLIIHHPKDPQRQIVKMQYGRKEIMFKKGKPDEMLDFGNDLKAAATDALKKCASELGIAGDVYAAEEFKEIKMDQPEERQPDNSEVSDEEIDELITNSNHKPIE